MRYTFKEAVSEPLTADVILNDIQDSSQRVVIVILQHSFLNLRNI